MDVEESGASLGSEVAAGLTQREAEVRHRRGEGNVAVSASSRSYTRILRTNVFSFFNLILFVIGAALLALGRYSDAFTSVGLGLVNAAIGAVQEIRAKRKLDRLQLLDRSRVTVVRDGRDVEVVPEEIVRGDVVHVRPGDQLVVDGPVLDGGRVDVDESLLTGESEPLRKLPGDDLLSGSFCVGGEGHQLAREVGASSYASRLTADARQTTTDRTPLQNRIEFVVRLVMLLVALMSVTILFQAALEGFTLVRVVQTTAVLSGLVPYGLFFLVAVAYTVGAAKSSGRGALVQQVNAVESVSNVDVVCTDKTGTLTTGRLGLAEVQPVGTMGSEAVGRLVGSMARSTAAPNLTTTALATALPGDVWPVRDEIPFSSTLRWSALRTDDGLYVLGAPDRLAPHLSGPALTDTVGDLTAQGLRVLVVARAGADTPLRDTAGRPHLPALEPVAVVSLADELRPDVPETIAGFARDGIDLKVVSGDDPRTVAALARQAGLDAGLPVAGRDLDGLSDPELDRVVGRTTVFGRIAPEQKERLVESLRRQGRYVAMIGDGVNDARALKRAHVGVAMKSGSAVARDVADIVLTDDSLGALRPAQHEGRRIINGIGTSMQVFLARVGTQALVILAVTMLGLGFPYSPANVGLTLLTVGVPTLFLTAWARPTPPDPHLLPNLGRFVVPAAVITAAGGVALYAYHYTFLFEGLSRSGTPEEVLTAFERYTGLSSDDVGFTEAAATIGAQTALSTFVSFAAFLLILFLKPPNRLFASWTRPDGDRRPAVLVVVLVAVFTGGLFIPAVSDYFGLTGAADPVFFTVLPALVLWLTVLSAAYRFRVLERALGLAIRTGQEAAGR
ncbi:cation-transporting ATPase E [Blastococcus colisei]|uniref:Cation-transporting ATPase E n=1 Tax=Blastococcus colisei TaxID=1564162 RepID=A0A543PFI9_9ACTN|nr:HAD-IC family P-type ATPase [Blastococcus colisei]TQN42826.1 cation-transporting ATPase E [Blastococcus colisei]